MVEAAREREVDPDTLMPVDAIEPVLAEVGGDGNGRFKPELRDLDSGAVVPARALRMLLE